MFWKIIAYATAVVSIFGVIGGLHTFFSLLPRWWGKLTGSPAHLKPFYVNRQWERDEKIDEHLHKKGQYLYHDRKGTEEMHYAQGYLPLVWKVNGKKVRLDAKEECVLVGTDGVTNKPRN